MNLISKILKASNVINKKARTGSANYAVLSDDTKKAIDRLLKQLKRKEKILNIFNGEV